MRNILFLFATLFSATTLFSQTAPPPEDNVVSMNNLQGLLRTQLTITPAWNVKGSSGSNTASISSGRTNVYLHGTLEYYWTEHFSTRGDAFYFLNKNKTADGGLKYNHGVQVGASYHLLKGMGFDPFIGVTGGVSLVQTFPVTMTRGDGVSWAYPTPAHLEPIWAPRVGMNFFGQHVFHFFVEAEYLMGNYRPAVGPIFSLNEVRVSAGLGFNWVILHKEATLRQTI